MTDESIQAELAANASREYFVNELLKAQERLAAANARTDAAEQLETAYKAAFEAANEALTRAESEAAQWKAKCEAAERDASVAAKMARDLKVAHVALDANAAEYASRIGAAESSLAEARALLGRIRQEAESVNGKYVHPDQLEQAVCGAFDRIKDLLKANPEATRAPTRTDHERAVLDACARLKIAVNEFGPLSRLGKPVIVSSTGDVADAVQAWREAAK